MIITEADLRDQLRRPTTGARVILPPGAGFSPSAADFVKQWALQIEDGDLPAAASDGHRHAAPGGPAQGPSGREWDTASRFPVQPREEIHATCSQCGEAVQRKADGLTQLSAWHFVAKNHPRIKFRGKVDSLHALVLMTQHQSAQAEQAWLTDALGSLAAYCREITSAEYNERNIADLTLAEADAEQIHAVTHDPRATLGIDHLTINELDPQLQHWLNMCRTSSRELELIAIDTFGNSPHSSPGASICHALNRLSSAFYYLQLRLAKELS